MGYKHYFTTKDEIGRDDIKRIKTAFGLTLSETIRAGIKLKIEDGDEISFNGVEDEEHEQFIFNGEKGFSYCKTNDKPYDLAVMICLVVAKEYLKGEIVVRSDGKSEDWQQARNICQKILGFGENFELDGEKKYVIKVLDRVNDVMLKKEVHMEEEKAKKLTDAILEEEFSKNRDVRKAWLMEKGLTVYVAI